MSREEVLASGTRIRRGPSIRPTLVNNILLGLHREMADFDVPPGALIDCNNVEYFQTDLQLAVGYAPFENMTLQQFPDNQGGLLRYIGEYRKFDGSVFLMVITDKDVYARLAANTWIAVTPVYRTGTISVNGVNVIGVGTTFLTNVKAGDRFKVDAEQTFVTVLTVVDDTHLTLSSAYPAIYGPNQPYTVRKLFFSINLPSWQATVVNDQFVFSNADDGMFEWDGTTTGFAIPIPGAPRAAALTNFQARPIAGRTVEANLPFPQRVRWPDIGTNNSWTEQPGSEASHNDIAEGPDWVVAVLPYGSHFVGYKERSIHLFTYVGVPLVFTRQQVVARVGLIAPRAVLSLGDLHLLLGQDGLYTFNGLAVQTTGEEVYEEIKSLMDPSKQDECFMGLVESRHQIHLVIPLLAGGQRDYVFHYRMKTHPWTRRDLPATAIGFGRTFTDIRWIDEPTDPVIGAWTGDNTVWVTIDLTPDNQLTLFGDLTGLLQLLGPTSTSFAGASIPAFAKFGAVGKTEDGYATSLMKLLSGMEPWFDTAPQGQGAAITLTPGRVTRYGQSMDYTGATSPFNTDGSSNRQAGARRNGLVFSLEIASNGIFPWTFRGYGLYLTTLGEK